MSMKNHEPKSKPVYTHAVYKEATYKSFSDDLVRKFESKAEATAYANKVSSFHPQFHYVKAL